MLIREIEPVVVVQTGIVLIMSDIAIVVSAVKHSLKELSKQAALLGNGLYNAAPGDKQGTPNNSVQYLLATAEHLNVLAEACEKITAKTEPPNS